VSKVEKLHIEYLLEDKFITFIVFSFPALFVWVCVVLFFAIVFLLFIYSFPPCFFIFLV
jgi:hypothetical protein